MTTNRRFKFTDTALKKIRPEAQRVEYVDTSRKGLRLRLTANGTKTFIFRYKFNGRSRLLTLGEFGPTTSLEQANQRLGDAKVAIKSKIDPAEVKQQIKKDEQAEILIPDLIDEYIERYAKRKKASWQEDQRILNKDVRPAWKHRKAADIKRKDVVRLLDEVEKRGIPTRNRLQAVLSKMFRVAISRGHLDSTPCILVEREKEEPRKRRLDDAEIKTFWNKLETASATDYIKTGLRLLLVTGQRRGELAHAEWRHVDLVKGEWFMPMTKNGHPHRIPLSSLAIELFTRLKEQTRESLWVLPSPRVHPDDKPVTDRALSRAVRNNQSHFGLERFTPHDLRRTFVTKLNGIKLDGIKIDRATVEHVVNHLAPKIDRIYNQYDYWDEMTTALEAWADELKRITEAAS